MEHGFQALIIALVLGVLISEFYEPLQLILARILPEPPLIRKVRAATGLSRVRRPAYDVVRGQIGDALVQLSPGGLAWGGGVAVGVDTPSLGFGLRCVPTSRGGGVRSPGAGESRVGDPAFDDVFLIEGDQAAALAVLTAEVRALLLALVRDWRYLDFSLVDNRLSVVVPGNEGSVPQVAACVQSVVSLAERLRRPHHVAAGLLKQMRSDPQPGVRTSCLLALVQAGPSPQREAALDEAARADIRSQRLIAAIVRADTDVLPGLRGDIDAELDAAVAGLRSLPMSHLDRDARRRLGVTLLDMRSAGFITLGARVLGACCEAGDREVEDLLLALLVEDEGGTAGWRGARPGGLDGPRDAIIEALGQVGTAAAVPRLLALNQADDPPAPELVREAIDRIQARIVGAGAGAGAIRLAAPDRVEGAIRLAEPDAREGAIRVARERQRG